MFVKFNQMQSNTYKEGVQMIHCVWLPNISHLDRA